jgi:beta-N-acetylhexosaminidase
MFIGIDEEGGIISRLNQAQKLHSTVMPPPFEIGSTGNTEYAYLSAKAIAEEIKSLGFNLDFAPVADVFSNPLNKIIGWRAYSSDGPTAAKMVAKAVNGISDAGVIPVLKHFPGHGDTLEDSHTGAAVINNSLERLKEVEFLPFESGIDAGARMVMIAHVLTPKITGNGLPATLSEPIIQGILRKQLGFDGVVITDSLEMSAITAFYPEEEAVVMAVQAGTDMLLMPNDLNKAYNAILKAVKDGRISEERIDESVRRILKLKFDCIISAPSQSLDAEKVLGSLEHRLLSEQIRKDIKP